MLAQFVKILSLLVCYFLPDFPYILLVAAPLQGMVVVIARLVPYYFAMKWFRSEIRFFVTSLVLFARLLFIVEPISLLIAKNPNTQEIDKKVLE